MSKPNPAPTSQAPEKPRRLEHVLVHMGTKIGAFASEVDAWARAIELGGNGLPHSSAQVFPRWSE